MKNRITEMLKIKYPIAMGGMAGVTDGTFAAAVSEAGGLGTIGAFKESGQSLATEIRRLKELSVKPFAVNVPLIVPQVADLMAAALENQAPVVVTAAGDPRIYTKQLQASGIRVIHVAPCVDLARRAEDAGVDAIIAEGFESGGFASPYEIGTLALVPQVVDAVKVPVLAAGGIADCRGYAASLILGAEGVSVGTVFLLTTEARRVGTAWRGQMLKGGDSCTKIVARRAAPFRALINNYTPLFEERILLGASKKQIVGEIISSDWGGDEDGLFTCGQGVGLIKRISTVKQVIDEFVGGSQILFEKMSQMGFRELL
ncbi:MAG: nitronate monooxygenase [Syntrophobacteraceae bacterium]|jgi:enoyl-[acyl-carrier protein] reductase II